MEVPLLRPLLYWLSQKPNQIIILLYTDGKKLAAIVGGTDNLFWKLDFVARQKSHRDNRNKTK